MFFFFFFKEFSHKSCIGLILKSKIFCISLIILFNCLTRDAIRSCLVLRPFEPIYPDRTSRHGNGRFRSIPEISWKQYSSKRIRWPDLSGSARNLQDSVKTDSRIRFPDSCVEFLAFSGGFLSETASFLRVCAGNSWNTASGIIVLGNFIIIYYLINSCK